MDDIQTLCYVLCLITFARSNIVHTHYKAACSSATAKKKGESLKCAKQCSIEANCIGFTVGNSACDLKKSVSTCPDVNPLYINKAVTSCAIVSKVFLKL